MNSLEAVTAGTQATVTMDTVTEPRRHFEIGHGRRPAIKLSFRLQTQIFKPGKVVVETPPGTGITLRKKTEARS